jgi:hypothetical protein
MTQAPGGRWRAVWHEDGQRRQCEAATEGKLTAKLEMVKVRRGPAAPGPSTCTAPDDDIDAAAVAAYRAGPARASGVRALAGRGIREDLTAVGARPDGRSQAGGGCELTRSPLTGAPAGSIDVRAVAFIAVALPRHIADEPIPPRGDWAAVQRPIRIRTKGPNPPHGVRAR